MHEKLNGSAKSESLCARERHLSPQRAQEWHM